MKIKTGPKKNKPETNPPGRIRIIKAVKTLLQEKDFNSITWAEIAKTAKVNEALIYKYFQDKRNLLHQVLADQLKDFKVDIALLENERCLDKLRALILNQLKMYQANRVFAKILLLEVRNFPGYFKSKPFKMVKTFSKSMVKIIEEGINNGELRDDIPPQCIRDIILGAIEHMALPFVLFDRKIKPEEFTEHICNAIFSGIEKNN